ncbi:hypothetical protein L6164_027052 [Bauhinia variegata]|uniref:Uncharacterized protein n=1 Tax=Bauhinia variegata TaxID=167791 RepID=A0ACB9LRZ3_BAUVA|nr:hypothetical protein L6164_027052 [Bauhinia variegata]
MTRAKTKVEIIRNEAIRKATFKNRKESLTKKISEMNILCGVGACAIMFNPNDPQPELWPSPEGVEIVINRFRDIPEWAQRERMMNQESYAKKLIGKWERLVRKQKEDNHEKEMTRIMFQYLDGTTTKLPMDTDFNCLEKMIDQKLESITKTFQAPPQVEDGNIHK